MKKYLFVIGCVCLAVCMSLMGYSFYTMEYWLALVAYGCLYLAKQN